MANEVAVNASKTRAMIEQKWPDIQKCLPKHVTPERQLRVVQNALGKNPKLLECTPASLIGAVVLSSELGLEINTPLGMAYIIPYENSIKNPTGNGWTKVYEAQFQIGYQGLLELCQRSGKVRNVSAECVHKNDKFSRTLGLHRDLIHEPAAGDRGEVIGYYAVIEFKDGGADFAYLTKEEAFEHGKQFSKAFAYDIKENKKSSPWSKNFDAMAKKTCIIKVLKYAPRAIEDATLRQAMEIESDFSGAIDVKATPIDLSGTDAGRDDTRKNLLNSAKALIKKYADIPGGLTLDDFDLHAGGSMAEANDTDAAESIGVIRLKCETIAEMQKQFPKWAPATRAIEIELDSLDAMWNDLKEGN